MDRVQHQGRGPGGALPGVAREFLEKMRPGLAPPDQQSLNWAWILGTGVPRETVEELDSLMVPEE